MYWHSNRSILPLESVPILCHSGRVGMGRILSVQISGIYKFSDFSLISNLFTSTALKSMLDISSLEHFFHSIIERDLCRY